MTRTALRVWPMLWAEIDGRNISIEVSRHCWTFISRVAGVYVKRDRGGILHASQFRSRRVRARIAPAWR